MNAIELFSEKVKPRITKGKKMFAPLETGIINKDILCIRDKDVNIFLIKSDNGWLAIDSGYKNSISTEKGLKQLDIIEDKVYAVFLTHVDLDHAGGIDCRCNNVFSKAKVYVGKEEEKYLLNQYLRKKILFFNCKTPIKLQEDYKTLQDRETIIIDGVKVEAIYTPGHTLGHMSFVVMDKYLFTGDTLILNHEGGYCMYDLWNISSGTNKQSLKKLEEIANENSVEYIITAHTGYCNNIEKAFKNIRICPNWKDDNFEFIPEAKDNLYDE